MFAFGMPGPRELAVVALLHLLVIVLVVWVVCRITRR